MIARKEIKKKINEQNILKYNRWIKDFIYLFFFILNILFITFIKKFITFTELRRKCSF